MSTFSALTSVNLSDYFRSSLLKPVAVAFTEARDVFEKKGKMNSRKKLRLDGLGATSLEDILVVVESARLHYDKDQSGSKLRRYMEQIARRDR